MVAPKLTAFKGVADRLIINSSCLLEFLGKLNQTSMKSVSCHLRPFKYLIYYEKQIRDKVKELESACADEPSTLVPPSTQSTEDADTPPPTSDETAAGSDKSAKKTAEGNILLRNHLRLLVGFMDEQMADIFKLRKDIDEAHIDEISYGELWHLYRPGQLVLSKVKSAENTPRAFRVLHVTGGRVLRDLNDKPTIDPLGESDDRLDEDLFQYSYESAGQTSKRIRNIRARMSPVIVDCCYIEYDGEEFGPKSVRFVILEYQGKLPIQSLDIYPLSFDSDPQDIHQTILTRGKKF
jgi:hypothetical protein